MSIVNNLKAKIAALVGMEFHEPSGRLVVPRVSSADRNAVGKAQVSFLSGKVLVCDWPDLDDLTRVINREIEDKCFDLSTVAGCAEQTKFIAEKYGFVSVSVGNTDPTVFFNGSVLVVGNRPYNETLECDVDDFDLGYRALTEINTNYWWCTLVDMEALRAFCQQHLDVEATNELIRSVEANSSHAFINIEPGVYNLYFDNRAQSFESALKQHEHTANAISQPKFLMTKENLDTVFDMATESFAVSVPSI